MHFCRMEDIIEGLIEDARKEVLPLLQKYCNDNESLFRLLDIHSRCVGRKALSAAYGSGLWEDVDSDFVARASMLHDIGIVMCDAPKIFCHGELPYICHGVEGRRILEAEGLGKYGLVCERHTGSGITKEEIEKNDMPLPRRDMLPVSLEEKLVCYADKFYSKSGNPEKEKSITEIRKGLSRFGPEVAARFDMLHNLFCKFEEKP